MPNIENISVRSTTLKPNGILIGGVTSNNGVLSFVANSYFEIPNGRQANATYVVKFTTPNANPTALKDILHIESWEAIEVTTAGKIYAWDFTNTAEVTLVSTMALNTTYWIKAVHSGTTRTYYLSTDGENYSQVASFNDTATDLNFDSPAVIDQNRFILLRCDRILLGQFLVRGRSALPGKICQCRNTVRGRYLLILQYLEP